MCQTALGEQTLPRERLLPPRLRPQYSIQSLGNNASIMAHGRVMISAPNPAKNRYVLAVTRRKPWNLRSGYREEIAACGGVASKLLITMKDTTCRLNAVARTTGGSKRGMYKVRVLFGCGARETLPNCAVGQGRNLI